MKITPLLWRKWHRWIAWPASVFLSFAAVTGVLVAFTEFFGEAEALREATRDQVSPMTIGPSTAAYTDALTRALGMAMTVADSAPVDRIVMQFKGANPTIEIFTGKRTGGEDRRLIFDARTGALLRTEAYVDKPFLYRLHSGEAFGDGGLVVAMMWGLSLFVLTITGVIVYWRMRKPGATGIKRFFW